MKHGEVVKSLVRDQRREAGLEGLPTRGRSFASLWREMEMVKLLRLRPTVVPVTATPRLNTTASRSTSTDFRDDCRPLLERLIRKHRADLTRAQVEAAAYKWQVRAMKSFRHTDESVTGVLAELSRARERDTAARVTAESVAADVKVLFASVEMLQVNRDHASAARAKLTAEVQQAQHRIWKLQASLRERHMELKQLGVRAMGLRRDKERLQAAVDVGLAHVGELQESKDAVAAQHTRLQENVRVLQELVDARNSEESASLKLLRVEQNKVASLRAKLKEQRPEITQFREEEAAKEEAAARERIDRDVSRARARDYLEGRGLAAPGWGVFKVFDPPARSTVVTRSQRQKDEARPTAIVSGTQAELVVRSDLVHIPRTSSQRAASTSRAPERKMVAR